MTPPAISALIPLYHNERFIAEAVESVLRQTLPVMEIVIVDDGSTDGSIAAVPDSPLIKIFARPHSGLAATLNHALTQTKGDWLAFLDHDDRWLPTKLEKQYAALQQNPESNLCFCQARKFYDNAPVSGVGNEILNGVAKSGFFVSRAIFDQVGPFSDTTQSGHDFLDWYTRAQELKLHSHIVPEVLYERRIHENNMGLREPDKQRASYFTALKASLDRRRANTS